MAATVVLVQGFGEPYSFWGDKAVEETAVEQATRFTRSLGPRSNWDFFHPGPVMFYALGPLYWLTAHEPLAISIGALMVNTAAGIGVVVAVHRFLGRGPATVAAFLVALYFWAWSGPGVWEHWNPALVPLPLLLACVLWAGAWSRSWRWLLAGWIPASFAVQTHIGSIPLVLAAFSVGALGSALRRWGRRPETPEVVAPRPRPLVTTSLVGVLVILWAPPLGQQLRSTGDDGNLRRVVAIARSGPELLPGTPEGWPLGRAWRAVANEATRVPFGWEPAPSPTLPVDLADLRLPAPRAVLWLASLGLAAGMLVWGARTGRWAVVGLSAMTLATAVVAVVAATRVPAKLSNHQLWGSAALLLPVWIAVGTVVSERVRARHARPVFAVGLALCFIPVVAFAAALRTPVSEPIGEQAVAVAALVRQRLGDERSVTVAWDHVLDVSATGVVATLRREGVDARVVKEKASVFSEGLTADGTEGRRLLLAPASSPEATVAALQPSWRCPLSRAGEVAGVEVWTALPRC